MDAKLARICGAVALFVGLLYLLLLWQPARQVRLHQAHFLGAMEKKDAKRLSEFIADKYSDRWGHDKEFVIRESREIFGHFIACRLQQEERYLERQGQEATVGAQIILTGTGSPIADYAKQRIGELTEPFVFRWERQSWKPWDWQLVSVNQPQLDISIPN